MSTETHPLRPELIAAKLDDARNFKTPAVFDEIAEEPRLVEMLWFIQWVSQTQNYPGGLVKFAADLVAQSWDFISTPAMKASAGRPYSEAVKQAILNELPSSLRWDRKVEDWLDMRNFIPDEDNLELGEYRLRGDSDEARKLKLTAEAKARHAQMKEAEVVGLCSEAASEGLAQYLERLCEQPDIRFRRPANGDDYSGGRAPKHFPRCAEAILAFMDRWKALELAKIAETEVSRHCFLWLEKAARLPGRGIMIEGNSRFGKTDAVRAWCQAHPGRARFVRTPPAGGEAELLRAVALALGINRALRYRAIDLRAEIEFVLRHSGLMLIFDEAQFIFPTAFSKNTMPARLNWIRCNVLDAKCPAVFIFTPQSYRSAKSKFVKTTGFAIEQFEGRILKTVLPPEVSREDLLSIARIHFRGVAENCIEWAVSMLAATERNFVSDVSNVATLALFNAELAGRATPKLADIKAAVADVLPPATALPDSTNEKAESAARPRAGKAPATEFQRPCNEPATAMHDRELSPADLMPGKTPLERFDAAAIDLATPA